MRSRTYAMAGAERACSPVTARTPCFFASAARSSASLRPLPSGHSQYTALPASSAAVASSRWWGTFTVTATTSTVGLFTSSRWLSNAAGTPKSLPAASADPRRVVESAVISKSSRRDLRAGMCACAAHPRAGLAPMMPTRILLTRPVRVAIRTDRSSDGRYLSGLDHFDFERELDLFAHEEAAGLERDVPG